MSRSSKEIRTALVLDHRREALGPLAEQLRRAGYDVTVSQSVDESQELAPRVRPDLCVAHPLVCRAGGVEFTILEGLQMGGVVPLLILAETSEDLQEVRHLDAPLRDVLLAPFAADEFMHRVDLAASALHHVRDLETRVRELEGQVTNDFKTDLLSERHFRSLLNVEFKRAQRNKTPLSLLLLDVDNFKSINDSTDYAFGDEVLKAVATSVKNTCRETDFPARFGGDEFVVLLPQTSAAEAVQTSLRIRKRIADLVIRTDRHATRVSVSIGIDTFDGLRNTTAEELRRRANLALHEAKRRGKDQAWLYSDVEGGRHTDPGTPPASR